ncbi:MAG: hypothetical protein H6719_19910 [Sandaracinaceae bacterium]|nr:hypothetical protein [Sandaracinaceae bacterium]
MHRRRFLGASLGSLAFTAVAGPARLVLAQACAARTEPNIEGPFYLPGAPRRSALTDRASLEIAGTVTDTSCRPMADAVIEVWQADADGEYDLTGDGFRGQLRTNDRGGFVIRTIHPGRYLNGGTYRPSHIHVKVHANGRPPLTTQLYFPGDPHNDADPWFRQSLLLSFLPSGCHPSHRARFGFVV